MFIVQVAAQAAEGLSGADAVFHAIVGAIVSLMGLSKAVELLRDFGIIPEKHRNGGQSGLLTVAQITAIVQAETKEMCSILSDIRDDMRLVAEDTRQRQMVDKFTHKP